MKDLDENGLEIKAPAKKKDLAEVAKMLEEEEHQEKKPTKKAKKEENKE